MDGISWDFGVCLLPADPEDHKGVGRNGGGGVDAFTQPALRSTLVEFNGYLNRKEKRNCSGKGWKDVAGNQNNTLTWLMSLCDNLVKISLYF